ncbi:tRNA (adenosine(37)-N6)-dimethylallyltransferase MiaA [Ornithinibacillus halophilus]|uniref:tRNA dimethylallyltransferase n=1 Tax=Ornithinibacillus halophilus TaxID=930117 RepID=A0A1M5CFJ9_9BACI|nr:tRNA (adenosine(37)-N6)-dimethylallyltransferase MiaA [Ornithinibacillus halophilus]SHF53481.1 tRNA dimethylallyltransferase [Ornithinibacillus halophilus]
MKEKVIAIVGPTAVGKTALSIQVANKFNGEIISGDSMQVYKGLDIGTAKITIDEMQDVPHHLIDIKEPDEDFSVADFKENVEQNIKDISLRNKVPILVGGSGLYIQAALYDYQFSNQKRDEEITKQLERELEQLGNYTLYERLKIIDPIQAEKIHPNNHRRVIRALEVYLSTGKTMTEYQKSQQQEANYDIYFVGLEMERSLLYERINKRVDLMIENGLVQEVERLYLEGYENHQSMRGIGYKEFIPYFKGEYSLETAIELLKRNSRRFAKRQYTWFKNKMDINWYHVTPDTINEKFQIILYNLAGFLEEK